MPVRCLGGATHSSTAGSKVSTWMPTESMPLSATLSITARSSGGSNWISTGRPEASFMAWPQRAAYRAPLSGP